MYATAGKLQIICTQEDIFIRKTAIQGGKQIQSFKMNEGLDSLVQFLDDRARRSVYPDQVGYDPTYKLLKYGEEAWFGETGSQLAILLPIDKAERPARIRLSTAEGQQISSPVRPGESTITQAMVGPTL